MSNNPIAIGDHSETLGLHSALYIPDQLIAGDLKLITSNETLTGAAPLPRGAVVGMNTDGNILLCVKTATDGSEVPYGILADFADPTAGNVQAPVYLMGEFNERAVFIDPSWTNEDMKNSLRRFDIVLKPSISSAPPT